MTSTTPLRGYIPPEARWFRADDGRPVGAPTWDDDLQAWHETLATLDTRTAVDDPVEPDLDAIGALVPRRETTR